MNDPASEGAPPAPSLAERINTLFSAVRPRADAGDQYSNTEVAHALGVSSRYVAQLRNGSRDNPSADIRLELARFFSADPNYLFDRRRADPPAVQESHRLYLLLSELHDFGAARLLMHSQAADSTTIIGVLRILGSLTPMSEKDRCEAIDSLSRMAEVMRERHRDRADDSGHPNETELETHRCLATALDALQQLERGHLRTIAGALNSLASQPLETHTNLADTMSVLTGLSSQDLHVVATMVQPLSTHEHQ